MTHEQMQIAKLEAMLQMAMGAMETAIATMDKPHYGFAENQLDNACDARDGLVAILQELIGYQEKGTSENEAD